MQLGFIGQGILLVVSGVYFPVSVLPDWTQRLGEDLAGDLRAGGRARRHPRRLQGVSAMWDEIWPLMVIGVVSIPLGLEIFRRGERPREAPRQAQRSG